MDIRAGKLSAITEVTEQTCTIRMSNTNDSRSCAEISIDGNELEVCKDLREQREDIVEITINRQIKPILQKAVQKICKKCKIDDEDIRNQLNSLVEESAKEWHDKLLNRSLNLTETDPEIQSMLNQTCDLGAELTSDPELNERLLPIRKDALSKLTVLYDNMSQTISTAVNQLNQSNEQMRDLEDKSKMTRKRLFNVSSKM